MIRKLFLLCYLLGWSATAHAQTVTDERVWFTLSLQKSGTPASPWGASVDTIVRSRDGLNALDIVSLRPTVLYTVSSRTTVGAGYGFSPSFPAAGGTTIEHRVYGHYGWANAAAGGTLSLRTRIESRFFEGNSGPIGRLRQQVRFSRAFRKGSRLSFQMYDEILVNLNDTTRAAKGVDQNRAYGGFSFNAARRARVELGYLNQFSPGHRGAPDRMNHILSSAVIVSF